MLKISRESEINLINVLIDHDIISGKDLPNIKKVSTEKNSSQIDACRPFRYCSTAGKSIGLPSFYLPFTQRDTQRITSPVVARLIVDGRPCRFTDPGTITTPAPKYLTTWNACFAG